MKIEPEEKILEIFRNTIDSKEPKYDGSLKDIDFYSLMCKAASNNTLYNMLNSNMCMFNCIHNEHDSVLILFSIPIVIDGKEGKSKHITERIMDIVELLEKCFVTLDNMKSIEVKDEKFVYITAIKDIIDNEEDD